MWQALADPFDSDEVLSFKRLYFMAVGSDEDAVFQRETAMAKASA
jgi:hypothetical protein